MKIVAQPIVLASGGRRPDATQFSDSLIGTDQPFTWGNQYFTCQQAVGGTTGNADSLASRVNRGAGGLTFSGGGGGSLIFHCNGIPMSLSFINCNGHNQFAQVQIVSDSSSGTSCNTVGVAVFTQPNQAACYALRKNPQGTTAGVGIIKSVPGSDTLLGSVHAINPNDVVRLEVRASGGTNTLTVLINGVVVDTQTDTALAAFGYPSLDCGALFVGSQTTVFSNFACGNL